MKSLFRPDMILAFFSRSACNNHTKQRPGLGEGQKSCFRKCATGKNEETWLVKALGMSVYLNLPTELITITH